MVRGFNLEIEGVTVWSRKHSLNGPNGPFHDTWSRKCESDLVFMTWCLMNASNGDRISRAAEDPASQLVTVGK